MSSTTLIDRFVRPDASDGKVASQFVGIALVALLAATFVSFLANSTLTVFPLVGFVVLTAYGWYAYQAVTARVLAGSATASTVAILTLIIVYLFQQAAPAFELMGIQILALAEPIEVFGITLIPGVGGSGNVWSTSQDIYSLAPMVWGTLVTTLIAMLVAGPLGIAGAIFISEMAPPSVRETVKPAVEVLAGIPSIVYGFIGFVIINGYMMDNFDLPSIGSLFVVGLVVGLMSLPMVVTVAEDALSSVPNSMRDASVAMGVTEWQTTKSITLPTAFSGVTAALLLGVGRAVGETMAATVILGHSQRLPEPLYDVFGNTETLTSLIASQYGNAHGIHMDALFAAGVVLFVTVLVLSVGSLAVESRMKAKLEATQ